jgi:hypothetical protein
MKYLDVHVDRKLSFAKNVVAQSIKQKPSNTLYTLYYPAQTSSSAINV